jgi:hypothetical protein
MRGHLARQQVLYLWLAQLDNSLLRVSLHAHHVLQGIYAAIKHRQVRLLAFMDSILILLLLQMFAKHVQMVINALRMQS